MCLEPHSSQCYCFFASVVQIENLLNFFFKRTPIEGVAGGSGNGGSHVPYSQINLSKENKNLFKKTYLRSLLEPSFISWRCFHCLA